MLCPGGSVFVPAKASGSLLAGCRLAVLLESSVPEMLCCSFCALFGVLPEFEEFSPAQAENTIIIAKNSGINLFILSYLFP